MNLQPRSGSQPLFARTPDLDKIALLLDVDGTILDIAPTPRDVHVSASLRETLTRLAEQTGGAVAMVSGRLLSDLDALFAPLKLPGIGGHGAEIRFSAQARPQTRNTPSFDAAFKRRFDAIAADGILFEDKGHSLALHYRLAPDKELMVHTAVAAICSGLDSIEVLPGKAVVEIKPVGFNKGIAVRELMKHPPFAGRRPVFIGDDRTDEAAFAVLPEFDGVGISVGHMAPGAIGCFDAPQDVRLWLERISRGAEAL